RTQIDAFLTRVRALVELSKTGGRKKAGGGDGRVEIIRDDEGLVIDGRETHLYRTVWRVANGLWPSGADINAEELTEQAWASFAASSNLADGKWTKDDAQDKARALLDRIRRGA